ncbi:four helix bundle protein [Thermodesulfobacteriota bacterium]
MKRRPKSYKSLEIYQLALELAVEIHRISLSDLPKFEMYEEGGQIRRSSKSVVSNIVEGYGRKYYKNEFVKFLTYALASCDETKAHLEMLDKTESLSKPFFDAVYDRYKELGAKLFKFRQTVIQKHNIFDDDTEETP